MDARPLSTYPKDRETLLTYTKAIADNWEDESMAALEMGSLVEAILLDEAVVPEVQQLAALVAERDALRKALEEVHRRTGMLMHQNMGRWRMSLEHDKRTVDVLETNQVIAFEALSPSHVEGK